MASKASLAVALSKLKTFENPQAELEQYPTDSETAATLLHNADMIDGLEGKKVYDPGAGTGVLGIGALLLGAAVDFLEVDKEAIATLKENLKGIEGEYTITRGGVMPMEADIVVMNPPFGSQQEHADRAFLDAAMQSAPIIYSIHAAGSEAFLDAYIKGRGYSRTHTWPGQIRLRHTMAHHTRTAQPTSVLLVRLASQSL